MQEPDILRLKTNVSGAQAAPSPTQASQGQGQPEEKNPHVPHLPAENQPCPSLGSSFSWDRRGNEAGPF